MNEANRALYKRLTQARWLERYALGLGVPKMRMRARLRLVGLGWIRPDWHQLRYVITDEGRDALERHRRLTGTNS